MKTQRIAIRVRLDQESSWQEAARRENRSLSNWIASVCDAAAKCVPPQFIEISDGVYRSTGEPHVVDRMLNPAWEEYNKVRVPYPQAAIDSLQSPPISSGALGTSFADVVKNAESLVKSDACKPKRPEKPKGHTVKCSCLKCQQAKGWRG